MCTKKNNAFVVEIKFNSSFNFIFTHLDAAARTPSANDLIQRKDLYLLIPLVAVVAGVFENFEASQNWVQDAESKVWLACFFLVWKQLHEVKLTHDVWDKFYARLLEFFYVLDCCECKRAHGPSRAIGNYAMGRSSDVDL